MDQIETSTSPPGIPRAFDSLTCPGGREFDISGCCWGGKFDTRWEGWGEFDQLSSMSCYTLRGFFHRNHGRMRARINPRRLQGPKLRFCDRVAAAERASKAVHCV